MDRLRVAGGVPLLGSVAVSGSKNAALPIMAASILADGPCTLAGLPAVTDVETMAQLLEALGLDVQQTGGNTLCIATVDPCPTTAPYELVQRMRASFCVLGPLLARRGRAVVSLPGGCNIGTRPVDLHLEGLAALGAVIRLDRGYVVAEAPRLRGATIDLRGPMGSTVTGTANVMAAACLAEGTTVIRGAAAEPEIVDLGHFLISAGARIDGLGTDAIEIRGVESLYGTQHRVIPDRIEAGTLLLAAAIATGTVSVEGARADHLTSVLEALAEAGVDVARGDDRITVHASDGPKAIDVIARPYPGIPTDLQAQFMALLSLADGSSTICDDVFPKRFLHAAELRRLGARIEQRAGTARVDGVYRLSGAKVVATDLRSGAALVLAGLAARGETIVGGLEHLDRGYDDLAAKLAALGANIQRESPALDAASALDSTTGIIPLRARSASEGLGVTTPKTLARASG
ncbi:MAG: UDP-N-acetylglucosamine 1-carboxyvinyltransferase [Planctomycetota bacterium]|nr:MAG: UDP-N-acetylglucosamine 1-carboxyvinyltransferase [Planctomycetota bacterium]